MEIIKVSPISKCKHSCDFFRVNMDGMECGHPYFDNKSSYDRMIIDHNIPSLCPLRKEPLKITTEYFLNKY